MFILFIIFSRIMVIGELCSVKIWSHVEIYVISFLNQSKKFLKAARVFSGITLYKFSRRYKLITGDILQTFNSDSCAFVSAQA